MSTLAALTTTGVGGPAAGTVEVSTEDELIAAVRDADANHTPVLLIAGGSNLLIGDEGFDGTAIVVRSSGIDFNDEAGSCGGTFLTVQAGHVWDEVVAASLEHGSVGLEPLSGIPGSAGATPFQNVGAYGTDVSHTLASVRVWDRVENRIRTLFNGDLDFGYRTSLLKTTNYVPGIAFAPRFVVLSVDFQLLPGDLSAPIRYAQLADALGVTVGAKAPAAEVREAVLALRDSKGMVYRPEDPDTHSTGSFFTNPIVDAATAARLPENAPRYPDPRGVKLSAAWLIENAGFAKGYGLPGTPGANITGGRASLSTKHTLALTNRGDASAADITALALHVRDGVERAFGIRLHPEPLVVSSSADW